MTIRRLTYFGMPMLLALVIGCSAPETSKTPVESKDRLQEKIDEVIANGAESPVPHKSTTFSENEVNTALTVNLKEKIPKGITEPQVRLLGDSKIVARVVVNVDEFKKRSKRKNAGPLNFFGGKIPVVVRGDLVTRDGQGQFKLQSAEANGIPLPKSLVLDLLKTYTRSRQKPDGFNIEKSFELPAGIREIVIIPGEAKIVQ
ncbi:MAG TPA: hypothetical protein VNT76_06430 [Candidatus Binatus sp.]|nr:hypothetical protein [Candidatus Binatus sp.]